jgi:MoxR-like ATPase
MNLAEVGQLSDRILDAVGEVVVGKRDVLEQVLFAILANGHVLIEDVPGVAKTLIARTFAAATGLDFSRVQFTPDLMPADVTGSTVLDPRGGVAAFQAGPVFANLVLADEINRASPKTQSALLEAMQEHQVTVDGVSRPLPRPFTVIATQNPIEYEGTYPLPEAQLDRFLLRLQVGYPARDEEEAVLARRLERRADEATLAPVVDTADVLAMQAALEDVEVDPSIVGYVVAIVAATRELPSVEVGASPRGSLAVLLTARARAALAGRDFVTPEDVKAVAVPALAHRLVLRPELWVRGVRPEQAVAECLDAVPVPVTTP